MGADATIRSVFLLIGGVAGGVGVVLAAVAAAKSSRSIAVTSVMLLVFGGVFFVVGIRTGGEPDKPEPQQIDDLVAMANEWSTVDLKKLSAGEPSLVRGRKVAIAFRAGGLDEWLHTRHPPPMAATRGEVGVVIVIDPENDTSPTIYPNGARSYGSTFHCIAIAVPEKVVVAKWDRYVASPKSPPSVRTGGHWHTAGSGTVEYQGLSHDDEQLDASQLVAGTVPTGVPKP